MGETRKISELTEVTTLSGNAELVFVHYTEGSSGPSDSEPPSPSYVDGLISTVVCLKDASGLLYNNLILGGTFVTSYDHNGKPAYQSGYDQSQLQSMIWWVTDGRWLIQYRLWDGTSWGDWVDAYHSNEDVADPTQITTWAPVDSSAFPATASVESNVCSGQVSEKSYHIHGDNFVNGYNQAYMFVRITGEPGDTISVGDNVYYEDAEFSYDDCWTNSHVDFNEKFYVIADISTQINPETNAPTWDLTLTHHEDVSENCGGSYITDTGKLTMFSHIGGGPDVNVPITLK